MFIIITTLTYVTPTLKFLHHLSIVIALNSRDLSRVYIVQPGPLLFACVSQHTVLLVCVSKESFSSLVESVGQGDSVDELCQWARLAEVENCFLNNGREAKGGVCTLSP